MEPIKSIKPGETLFQASPTQVNYRGSSIVFLAGLCIAGTFLVCGWYVRDEVTKLRVEIAERDARTARELGEVRATLIHLLQLRTTTLRDPSPVLQPPGTSY